MPSFLTLPPTPAWDEIHPLIVHFPIALLIAAPLLGGVWLIAPRRPWAWGLGLGALMLMVLGTAGAYVAVESGEAAAEAAISAEEQAGGSSEGHPGIGKAIEAHAELAVATRLTFTILTAAWGLVVLGPVVLRKVKARWWTLAKGAVLVAYVGGMLLLINTGYRGGLVMEKLMSKGEAVAAK